MGVKAEACAIGSKSIGVHKAFFMDDLLASRVSPTATNLIDAGALARLRDGRSWAAACGVGERDRCTLTDTCDIVVTVLCRSERSRANAWGVGSKDRPPRLTRLIWP